MYDYDLVARIREIYDSCDEREKYFLYQILHELAESEDGRSKTYEDIWLADYKEIPVGINTFLDSDLYLGKTNRNGKAVYPFWRKELNTVFGAGNKYYEWVLTGPIRIGKSVTANTGASYMLYKLMCLRNPQEFFGKKENSTFSLLFFNLTKELAKGVAFKEFNKALKMSPWFLANGHFTDSEENPIYIPDGGLISVEYGSDSSHGLGKQVFCCMLDEVNFSQAGVKDINKAKQRMKANYDTLMGRITSTFKHGGEIFGKMFTCSSKKSDCDFLEDHVAKQRAAGADFMYVSDAPQWEVMPPETFSKERFYIAVGSRHQKGFVIEDNQSFPEALDDLKQQGFKIVAVPKEMKPSFKADFEISLRDLAGISVPGMLSFVTQEIIDDCITKERRNPFYSDTLQIGTRDNLKIEDFFHIEDIPKNILAAPTYIHFDLALVSDRAGISGVALVGRRDVEVLPGKIVSVPLLAHSFTIGIEAPRGAQIAYDKIKMFTLWLRSKGMNIVSTSRDQFQSEYLGQLLSASGFEDKKLSLDRTPDGYIAFRSILTEQRITLLDVKLLQDELIHLQRDSVTGKVDHPVGGSKDLADSLAGAVWNAVQSNDAIPVSGKSKISAMAAVNAGISGGLNPNDPMSKLPIFNNMFYRK
jgi:hypothetical protein